ncbi:hypothetical protein XBJ2_1880007 [Xenorhabdus bovienii str. Jollieti]|uniref:Uncharacterized protein n=1 Tax=Xenorhabdus bovienii (strain SS-2004) TaxID=406818 RepID=D3V5B0_XENBS|nr:hypothetical protein XBJ1_3721 [Xenorhabdus bovienii SS-2004]CDH28616.1 hypothetical protein XBJ2_1880007 [Xenorhabdus bovienii str. Jollieti]
MRKVFPVGTGINRLKIMANAFDFGVPRRYGDKPSVPRQPVSPLRCSP